jgi:intracellular multiplication protein IcmS
MDISQQCEQYATSLSLKFTLKGRDLSYHEVFSLSGLLPALVKRADREASSLLGYGLGAHFKEQEKSMLGKVVSFDTLTPNVLRLICLVYIIEEIAKDKKPNGKIPLDTLLADR